MGIWIGNWENSHIICICHKVIVTISGFYVGFYCIKAPLFRLELTKQCLVFFLSTYSKVKYALALAVADQTREDEDDTLQCVKRRLRRDLDIFVH